MIEDISAIAMELVELIKARQLETARQLVHASRRTALGAHSHERQRSVHEITLAIAEAKKQRVRLLREVEALPEAEQQFARIEIEGICSRLFDEEIARLTTRKRQLSRPGAV
jgi:hypothetical protein